MIYTIQKLTEISGFHRSTVAIYVNQKPFKKVIVGSRVKYQSYLNESEILELFKQKKSTNKSKNIIKYHESKRLNKL